MGAQKPKKRSQPQFTVLERRVQNVSEAAIRKKWKKLPAVSDNQLSQLLSLLKKQSATGAKKDSKGREAEQCVDDVVEKLSRKFPRMPFPPRTEEDHFDYEASLQRIRLLESQLTSNIHSIDLLRNQVVKEEAMLEQEEAELEVLRNGAMSSRALRKQQDKGLHPLARKVDLDENVANDLDDSAFSCHSKDDAMSDSDLKDLLKQFHHHVEGIRNNSAGLAEVSSAILEAQAAVERFTTTSLDAAQYERLYGLDIA